MNRFLTKLRMPATWVFLMLFLAPLLGTAMLGHVTQPHPLGLFILFLLSLGAIWVVPKDDLDRFYRFVIWVFIIAVFLHVAYELLHSVLYTHFMEPGFTYVELVKMLWGAAVGDGLIAIGLYLTVTLARRGRWDWIWPWSLKPVTLTLLLALAIQVVIEIFALRTDLWGYTDDMPLIPGLGVGMTPVLQMPLLMLPTLWAAQQMLCRPADDAS